MRRGVCLPLSSRKQAAKTNLTNGGSEISKTYRGYHATHVTQGANKYSNVDIVVKFAEFDKFEEN